MDCTVAFKISAHDRIVKVSTFYFNLYNRKEVLAGASRCDEQFL